MLGKLKNMFGKDSGLKILAPLAGEVIPVSQVNDPTFSEELLGKGTAIKPTGGRVVSPVNGTVTQMFETGHAVSLTSDEGIEILIHIGLDTIQLKGQYYTIHARDGATVKVGDLLMEFDREGIAKAGYDTVTPVVVCNTGDFAAVEPVMTSGTVKELEELIVVRR